MAGGEEGGGVAMTLTPADLAALKAQYPVSEDVEKVNRKGSPAVPLLASPEPAERVAKVVNDTHRAVKYESALIGRQFDSRAQGRHAEELWLRQNAGEISDLKFEVIFVLSVKPKVTINIDFEYTENGVIILEDCKGWKRTKSGKVVPRVERDFRVKLAWLKQLHGKEVRLVK